jgi:hypothetical protein
MEEVLGSDWLTTNFLLNQNYGKQKLRLTKIKAAKVRAENIRVHLVDYQNQGVSIFSFMQFKNFLETCQNFYHKYWCVNSFTMNQLMTTNFGMP